MEVIQRNRTPKPKKPTKKQSKNHSKKNNIKSRITVCALKTAKTSRKTQGKRQTKVQYVLPPKSLTNSTINDRKVTCATNHLNTSANPDVTHNIYTQDIQDGISCG